MNTSKASIYALIFNLIFACNAFCAEWTPIVEDDMFEGIRADLLVAVGGILSLVLIVVGLGVLIKAFLN